MRNQKNSASPFIQGVSKVRKRERIFELSLPALVKGKNAYGEEFQEKTLIFTLSSETASFNLSQPVVLGTTLWLEMEIPQTILLQTKLKMELKGEVNRLLAASNGQKANRQTVFLKLSSRYTIQPLPSSFT